MKSPLSLLLPWAKTPSDNRREPTAGELATGFPCGPADKKLFNELMYRMSAMEAELANLIQKSGFAHDENDLAQIAKVVRSQALNYAVAEGTADALIVTLNPALDMYRAGFPLRVKCPLAAAGATTISVNSLGFVPITYPNGVAIGADAWSANTILELVCTGTSFVLTSVTAAPGGGGGAFDIPHAVATGTAAALAVAFAPAITAPAVGDLVLVELAHNITGATTITVNALAAVGLCDVKGAALTPDYAKEGDTLLLMFDASGNWRILTKSAASANVGLLPLRAWARVSYSTLGGGISSSVYGGFSSITRSGSHNHSLTCTFSTPLADAANAVCIATGGPRPFAEFTPVLTTFTSLVSVAATITPSIYLPDHSVSMPFSYHIAVFGN